MKGRINNQFAIDGTHVDDRLLKPKKWAVEFAHHVEYDRRINNQEELRKVNKNVKKFAFDVDGTLVDDHFKLNKGVVEFIYHILKNDEINDTKSQFMICTGASYAKANKVIKMINEEIAEKFDGKVAEFKPDITCYGGSLVVKDGQIIRDRRIDRNHFNEIASIVRRIDENAIILLNMEDGMHFIKPKTISKDKVKIKVLQLLQSTKGEGGFTTIGEEKGDYHWLINKNDVYSLEILSLSSTKNKQITKELSELVVGVTISAGTTIQVSNGSKLKAIKSCMGKDTSNLLYVGDGYNDIPAMQEAGISFALGNKVKVLESADFAVEDFDDIYNAFNNNDYSLIKNKSESVLKGAKEAEEKKRAKKERGTINNAIYSVKEKLHSKKDEEREM
ncbi:MAG: HAD hydrolase family protein [Clostridia bacterium]|nr:HAD hydrolase family protein [Clostridia bacterium]